MAKPFCSLPWDGVHINQELDVFFCCLMAGSDNALGNLKTQSLDDIRDSDTARQMRAEFLKGVIPAKCQAPCGFKTGNIINDFTTSEQLEIFKSQQLEPTVLHSADIRSSNLCTLDCVYCGPLWSSTIAKRDGFDHMIPSASNQREYQQYIKNIDLSSSRRLFLAGGEPLLMKEYIDLLDRILAENPKCQVIINTGLSVINTPVFELLTKLKNVTWIVSVDTTNPNKFAYIRHGNTWENFSKNLDIVRALPNHKVTAHMVYFSLSYKDFDVSYNTLTALGLNTIIDPVSHDTLDIRNVPHIRDEVQCNINQYLAQGIFNQETYNSINGRLNLPHTSTQTIQQYLSVMDAKYNMDSKIIFPELYTYE